MEKRNFDDRLKTFRASINQYDYYTDFYASGYSKPNETARSYKMIVEEAKDIAGFEFVWITGGDSWKSARWNLKETFLVISTLYNICDLENGIFLELFND